MILLEDLVPDEDSPEHDEKWPGRGDHRASAVEDQKCAPQSTKGKLGCGNGQGTYFPECTPRFGSAFDQVHENDRPDRQPDIPKEDELGCRVIDASEEIVVERKTGDHRNRRYLPLILLERGDEFRKAHDTIQHSLN